MGMSLSKKIEIQREGVKLVPGPSKENEELDSPNPQQKNPLPSVEMAITKMKLAKHLPGLASSAAISAINPGLKRKYRKIQ